MVQTGALLGPLLWLVSLKAELYEDVGIRSPVAS